MTKKRTQSKANTIAKVSVIGNCKYQIIQWFSSSSKWTPLMS